MKLTLHLSRKHNEKNYQGDFVFEGDIVKVKEFTPSQVEELVELCEKPLPRNSPIGVYTHIGVNNHDMTISIEVILEWEEELDERQYAKIHRMNEDVEYPE